MSIHILARIALCLSVTVLPANQLQAQQSSSSVRDARADTVRDASMGTIDGIVTDTSLAPLRGAFVSILRTNIRVGTGPNGRFRITKVPAGQYLLIVKRGGFSPTSLVVEVPAADTVRLAYTLTPAATVLPGVTVTEQSVSLKMLDFERRKRGGQGEFMNADEIDRRGSVFATELMRKFTTINVAPVKTGGNSMTEYFALSRREGGGLVSNGCAMTVYLDQVPMPTPFNLDLLPSPRSLAGIEVYAGPSTIPPQFSGMNRGCGVIMVWTKDGNT